MARWDAELFARLVTEKYGSINKFARAIDTSPQGVRAWLPTNGPGRDRQQVVADALGVPLGALLGEDDIKAVPDSPLQADRIEAKLDQVLTELRQISANPGADDPVDDQDQRQAAAARQASQAVRAAAQVPQQPKPRGPRASRAARVS